MGLFSSDPIIVEVQGKVLKCLVCAHDQFNRREAVEYQRSDVFQSGLVESVGRVRCMRPVRLHSLRRHRRPFDFRGALTNRRYHGQI